MNRVQGPEFRRHRLRRAIQDRGVNLDEFERCNYRQDRSPARSNFCVRELCTEPQSIKRAQTLGRNQRA
jgi:hypothetical protein